MVASALEGAEVTTAAAEVGAEAAEVACIATGEPVDMASPTVALRVLSP